ncbi:MAG TPA: AAA family ATPase [Gaiellaceae bacterium]|nr:AAA family ATPase [Gaiellaceae bacterium]
MLLGREREREALAQLLDDARVGRSGVLALVGEAGIGKSALLEHALDLATGMRTLRARGIPSEAQIPFAALFELLRPALACLDAIPEPQMTALESALALRPARATERFAVGAATLSLLAAYADERPVLVVVDDIHWLDGSSADALLFAVRRLLAEPIAVVLAARDGEPSFLGRGDLPVLRLEGLGAEAAAELLRERARDASDAFAARLHRETGGNPLALLELAAEGLPEGPPEVPPPVVTTVAETYLARVARLPGQTREALLLAAVDRGDLAVLARAGARLGVAPEDLDPAVDAALVTVGAGRVEFRHPLLRAAVYGAATQERRRAVHRALAETLPDSDADRRAWHLALAAAGPDERASTALAQAAQRAHERSAYDVASQAFERAGRLAPTGADPSPLLYRAANAAWLGGAADRALALLDEAAATSATTELGHLHGHIALWRGPLHEGEATLRGAAAQADPEEAVVMLAEAVLAGLYAADPGSMHAAGRRAAELASRSTDRRVRFFGLIAEGMALLFAGGGERGAAAVREAVALLEESDELNGDPRLLVWAAMGPLWLREAGRGEQLVDRALEDARARSAAGALPHLLEHVSIHHAATDRWVEARAGFEEAVALARETGQRVVLAAALARLAWLEARSGPAEACRRHADEALATAREQGAALCEIWALAALRDLELGAGDVAAALAHAAEQRRRLDERGVTDPDLSPAPEQVELLLRTGRSEEAEELAAVFVRAAAAKGQPWAQARAARCTLLLAASADGARTAYDEATRLHARTSDVFEAARTHLAYGARLRREGERVLAREPLRAAVDAFGRLGAAPWSEAARAELLATGERARRRDPESLAELTAQELQVSLLLAAGRTTREAAAALFLSPKTIEYHLRNVYRKLGINSREQLRAELSRQATA